MTDSNDDKEFPPGFPFKQSTFGRMPISEGTEDRHGKRVSSAAHAGRGSCSVFSGTNIRSESKSSCAMKEETRKYNLDGKKVSLPRTGSICEGCPVDTVMSSKEVEDSMSRTENSAYNSADSSPLFMKLPPISSLGITLPNDVSSNCTEVQERNLQRISHNFQSGPALKVIWKGTFEVLDVTSEVRMCEGILAHPSAKVSRKAYKFSKQIAGVLQFRMHSRCDFWPEIFQMDCPDRNDIALYFYPGNNERSKRQYSSLLKFIEKQDKMLRGRMGHVELLVFPSKLLHMDFQKLDGSYFMWGVFRHLHPKGDSVAYKAGALHSSLPL